jgi:hypothetical protein
MKMNKKKIVIIGITVVVITAAIAFGVWEMQKPKPKSQLPKCTSINPRPDTDPIRRQCENIQEKDICHEVHDVSSKDAKLCQWRG